MRAAPSSFIRKVIVHGRTLGVVLSVLVSLSSAHAITPQRTPVILRNGEAVDLSGTLAVQHRGWKPFLVLRTDDPYALAPDALVASYPIPHPVTREFGLTLAGQDDRLARLAGRRVRVSGRLQFTARGDQPTPYLWNDTLVWATVVALPSGDYLDPKPPEPGLVLTVHRYTATAAFRPSSFTPAYTARDLDTRKPLTRANLAGCSVAADGASLNCACTDGFRPVSAILHTAKGDLPVAMISSFAHFALDDPAKTAVTAELECTRTASLTVRPASALTPPQSQP